MLARNLTKGDIINAFQYCNSFKKMAAYFHCDYRTLRYKLKTLYDDDGDSLLMYYKKNRLGWKHDNYIHPNSKHLDRETILKAQDRTLSNHATARYLHVSYPTLRKYAKDMVDDEGVPLLERNANKSGKGIPKFFGGKKLPAMKKILDGSVKLPSTFSTEKIKLKMIEEGYLEEQCSSCGFNEHRLIDYKVPLIMHFKDGNKMNFNPSNIDMLCYNCYFLKIGDPFSKKAIQSVESHIEIKVPKEEKIDWELDDYHIKRMRELGLMGDEEEDDLHKYISKI